GFFTGAAVAFLHQAGQLLGVAFNAGELVVSQVAPGFLRLALELLPLSLDGVFIHLVTPLCCGETAVHLADSKGCACPARVAGLSSRSRAASVPGRLQNK